MAEKNSQDTKHGVPALLSFLLPGLGQIVKGDIPKGIVHLIAISVSWLLTFVLIGYLLYPVVWIYSIYDAYNA